MRPVRNIVPRLPRDEDEAPVQRIRKKGSGLGRGRGNPFGNQRPTARAFVKAPSDAGIIRPPSAQTARRKRTISMDIDSDCDCIEGLESPTTPTSANHNKYCHFCQHVKVRASSMLACQNSECCRRFCEHCLVTHLNEDVDPMSSCAWSLLDGKPVWHCPICRKKCCCSQSDCKQDHRHCKAYRYRRRRAELATKRLSSMSSMVPGEKRVKKSSLKETRSKGSCGIAVSLPRPSITFGFVRASDGPTDPALDTPPSIVSEHVAFPRPRREAAAKGHPYVFGDESDEDGMEPAELEDDEVNTPAAQDPDEEECFECHVMDCSVPITAPHHGARSARSAAEVVESAADLWAVDEGGGGVPVVAATAFCDAEEDEHSEAMGDDVLGGIYGHMSQAREAYLPGEYELSGVPVPHDASVLEEGTGEGGGDTDEAKWIRRTYETVYNPAARQRALQLLTSDLNLGGKKGFSLPPPGRYPLDEGELFFLSGSRTLDSLLSREGDRGLVAAAAGAGCKASAADPSSASPSDGSDLSYFLQSGAGPNKVPLVIDVPPPAVVVAPTGNRCSVVYDFE